MLIDCENKLRKRKLISPSTQTIARGGIESKWKELKPQINIIISMMYPLNPPTPGPVLRHPLGEDDKGIILFNEFWSW